MNSYLTLVSAAALVLATAGLPDAAIGQTTTEAAADALLQRPTVDFAAFRESQLHLGMTAAEVASIMRDATKAVNYVNCAANVPVRRDGIRSGPHAARQNSTIIR